MSARDFECGLRSEPLGMIVGSDLIVQLQSISFSKNDRTHCLFNLLPGRERKREGRGGSRRRRCHLHQSCSFMLSLEYYLILVRSFLEISPGKPGFFAFQRPVSEALKPRRGRSFLETKNDRAFMPIAGPAARTGACIGTSLSARRASCCVASTWAWAWSADAKWPSVRRSTGLVRRS